MLGASWEWDELGSVFNAMFRLQLPACRDSGMARAVPSAVGAVLAPCPALGFPGAEPRAGFAAEQGQRTVRGRGDIPGVLATHHQISFLLMSVALPVAGRHPPCLPGRRRRKQS